MIAPFTAKAVGIITKFERRPEAETNLRNKNLAILQALAHVSKTLAPKWISENSIFRRELKKVSEISNFYLTLLTQNYENLIIIFDQLCYCLSIEQ